MHPLDQQAFRLSIQELPFQWSLSCLPRRLARFRQMRPKRSDRGNLSLQANISHRWRTPGESKPFLWWMEYIFPRTVRDRR